MIIIHFTIKIKLSNVTIITNIKVSIASIRKVYVVKMKFSSTEILMMFKMKFIEISRIYRCGPNLFIRNIREIGCLFFLITHKTSVFKFIIRIIAKITSRQLIIVQNKVCFITDYNSIFKLM